MIHQSMVHDSWVQTMKAIATTHPDTVARELATFAAEILSRCGDTPELAKYLDRRALSAFEKS